MKLKRWQKVTVSICSVMGIGVATSACQIDLFEGKNFTTQTQMNWWDPTSPYEDTYLHQGESREMAKLAFSQGFDVWGTIWAIDSAFQAHGDGSYVFNTILMYTLAVPFRDALRDIAYYAQFSPVDCVWWNGQGNALMGYKDADVGWRPDEDDRCRYTDGQDPGQGGW